MTFDIWSGTKKLGIAALVAVSIAPLCATAQDADYQPVPFDAPMTLTRGTLSPASDNGIYLTEDDYCTYVTAEWGWSGCSSLEAFVIDSTPDTDTLIINKPNSDGYVSFDDWKSADRDDQIRAIEDEMTEGAMAQSKQLGYEVKFVGWRVYPTLNEEEQIMYYAMDYSFDGDISTNIKASVFDRRGYVQFMMIPLDANLPENRIVDVIHDNIDLYRPTPTETYSSFTAGDTVAAVGALGVLAALVGVKNVKAASAGILATIAIFAKKFFFVLLLPVFWVLNKVKGMFVRRD